MEGEGGGKPAKPDETPVKRLEKRGMRALMNERGDESWSWCDNRILLLGTFFFSDLKLQLDVEEGGGAYRTGSRRRGAEHDNR